MVGGFVIEVMCKEQLLYEIYDLVWYLIFDVVVDFFNVCMYSGGKDCVVIEGVIGILCMCQLKVLIGYFDSYIGEGQISYVGFNVVVCGKLVFDIVCE